MIYVRIHLVKKKLVFECLFPLILLSCSRTEGSVSGSYDSDTLKNLMKVKGEATLWTGEIEPEYLTESLRNHEEIAENVKLSSETFSIVSDKSEKIFPYIEGFGSLDIESLGEKARTNAEGFCNCLMEDFYSAESYMYSSSVFSFVFFLDDLKNGFFSEEEEMKFSSFVLGSSFLSGDDVQIPIRLYADSKDRFVDIYIFLNEKDGKIRQIKIVGSK